MSLKYKRKQGSVTWLVIWKKVQCALCCENGPFTNRTLIFPIKMKLWRKEEEVRQIWYKPALLPFYFWQPCMKVRKYFIFNSISFICGRFWKKILLFFIRKNIEGSRNELFDGLCPTNLGEYLIRQSLLKKYLIFAYYSSSSRGRVITHLITHASTCDLTSSNSTLSQIYFGSSSAGLRY